MAKAREEIQGGYLPALKERAGGHEAKNGVYRFAELVGTLAPGWLRSLRSTAWRAG